ncbi:MAG: SgcJ/EcaC family oxidoreductase [Mycobacterium sp.]|nr:SgcJ/EcaC family oxidoreductase [Mycobacterium sp.]
MSKDVVRNCKSDRDSDEAAIRALLDRQIKSWDAGDPVAYASTYARESDCVSFLGSHYQGRAAIAASCEVPRAGSLLKRLLRGTRLQLQITRLRFLTPDVAVVHATCSAARGARRIRRNLRTNTSIAVRTADGWLLAASQNTTQRPLAERLTSKLVSG